MCKVFSLLIYNTFHNVKLSFIEYLLRFIVMVYKINIIDCSTNINTENCIFMYFGYCKKTSNHRLGGSGILIIIKKYWVYYTFIIDLKN